MMRVAMMIVSSSMMLAGCAGRMDSDEPPKPIMLGPAATSKIVLRIDGSELATQAGSWPKVKEAMATSCQEEAKSVGLLLSFQEGAAHVTAEPGTLLDLYINDFRHISMGMRFFTGLWSGNAYIDANTKFLDLQTGALRGERSYRTDSFARDGRGKPTTAKQVQEICKGMLDAVRGTDKVKPKKKSKIADVSSGVVDQFEA